jgi:CP family cyanate transporter-like MFS transporter
MTALYTTAMAIGTTAGAGLTVPIGSLASHADAWRLGIGAWAILSAVAIVPWLAVMRHSSAPGAAAASARVRAAALARSRIAWMVTLFFAFQSMQAYIAVGWFERFLTEHSISDSSAGWMVALMSAMAIPTSMAAPMVPARHHRPLVVLLGVCYGGAYAGMNLAPGASWLWMVFAGVGNGMFPMSLTLMGYRTAAPATTASLSAFAQGVGYTIAATGPVLFGALHGATGTWAAPFAVLWTALAISTIAGWLACTPRTVDEDLPVRPRHR